MTTRHVAINLNGIRSTSSPYIGGPITMLGGYVSCVTFNEYPAWPDAFLQDLGNGIWAGPIAYLDHPTIDNRIMTQTEIHRTPVPLREFDGACVGCILAQNIIRLDDGRRAIIAIAVINPKDPS